MSFDDIDADGAGERAEREREALVRRAQAAPFVEGAEGECEECGERRPRIVAGRCCFCRDRRAV